MTDTREGAAARTAAGKRTSGFAVLKKRADDAEAAAARFKDENDRLTAKLAEVAGQFAASGQSLERAVRTVVEPRDEEPGGLPDDIDTAYHEELDPLRIVRGDEDEISFVSRASAVLRTPSGENAALHKIGANAWKKDYLFAIGTRLWRSNPFDYGGATDEEKRANRKANEYWHRLVVTQEDARMAFPDGHPKRDFRGPGDAAMPCAPGRAIVYPGLFRGISRRGQLLGRKTRCSDVPLREFVRITLQYGCSAVYFDTDSPPWETHPLVDRSLPNPYARPEQASIQPRHLGKGVPGA